MAGADAVALDGMIMKYLAGQTLAEQYDRDFSRHENWRNPYWLFVGVALDSIPSLEGT